MNSIAKKLGMSSLLSVGLLAGNALLAQPAQAAEADDGCKFETYCETDFEGNVKCGFRIVCEF